MTLSLEDKVDALRSGQAFAASCDDIQVKETHMSWVFLAGDRVYKLKKPVHSPYLDLRLLHQREFNCREEVRLNRRLAPDIYLAVKPLLLGPDGRISLSGSGEVVDWLVEMRRIPEPLLLDHAIKEGRLQVARIMPVADLLAAFYSQCFTSDVSADDYVAQFRREHDLNKSILNDAAFSPLEQEAEPALQFVERTLESGQAILRDRVAQGRIVEGHGDLRPEHVCLTRPPVIIDCLEFNRQLRLIDPFDEVTFLGLECEVLGAGWIGEVIRDRLMHMLDDRPDGNVLSFYRAYRACLRARLAAAHLLDPKPREPAKWIPLARKYLAAALSPMAAPAASR